MLFRSLQPIAHTVRRVRPWGARYRLTGLSGCVSTRLCTTRSLASSKSTVNSCFKRRRCTASRRVHVQPLPEEGVAGLQITFLADSRCLHLSHPFRSAHQRLLATAATIQDLKMAPNYSLSTTRSRAMSLAEFHFEFELELLSEFHFEFELLSK